MNQTPTRKSSAIIDFSHRVTRFSGFSQETKCLNCRCKLDWRFVFSWCLFHDTLKMSPPPPPPPPPHHHSPPPPPPPPHHYHHHHPTHPPPPPPPPPHTLSTKAYTLPKFEKHPLFADFGRKKHTFFNRNRWFWGPIKHTFFSKTRNFRNIS